MKVQITENGKDLGEFVIVQLKHETRIHPSPCWSPPNMLVIMQGIRILQESPVCGAVSVQRKDSPDYLIKRMD